MRILFYTSVFAPSVGGIETLTETLCRQFVRLGHQVVVVTISPGTADVPFEVVRRPRWTEFCKLLSWCDVFVQANVSLRIAWTFVVAPHKIIYQHNATYQRDDGTRSIPDRIKTVIAHAAPGIANSTFTSQRTGAGNVILNAYDDELFGSAPHWTKKDRDLVFLGRLVSQKGCDTLIDALASLAVKGRRVCLTVIGDGPERAHLERQTEMHGLKESVTFVGTLKGRALAKELSRHRVIVVPSRYEEPFGLVALEGLACGCVPIVSERGGLVDAIGKHGFSFPNEDAEALARQIEQIHNDPQFGLSRLVGVEEHLDQCRARNVAQRYISVFQRLLERRV